jgi:hypothetical protein
LKNGELRQDVPPYMRGQQFAPGWNNPTEGESWLVGYNETSPCRRLYRWLGLGSCRWSQHLHEPFFVCDSIILPNRQNYIALDRLF